MKLVAYHCSHILLPDFSLAGGSVRSQRISFHAPNHKVQLFIDQMCIDERGLYCSPVTVLTRRPELWDLASTQKVDELRTKLLEIIATALREWIAEAGSVMQAFEKSFDLLTYPTDCAEYFVPRLFEQFDDHEQDPAA